MKNHMTTDNDDCNEFGEEWVKSTITRAELRGCHQCNTFNFSEGL